MITRAFELTKGDKIIKLGKEYKVMKTCKRYIHIRPEDYSHRYYIGINSQELIEITNYKRPAVR